METKIKICGVTNLDDALDAVELGADYLGFNFYQDSKRFIPVDDAIKIFEDLPPSIQKVGVFVNAQRDYILDISIALELDFIQFHGDESPSFCNDFGRSWMKAFRLKEMDDLKTIPEFESDFLLVDAFVESAYGGTGVMANWDLAREAKKYGKLFLSGGLNPENVEMAISAVKPYAVDVASGVEYSPGKKDRFKMEEFIKKIKRNV